METPALFVARAVLDTVGQTLARSCHLLGEQGSASSHASAPLALGRPTVVQDDLCALVSVMSAVRMNAAAVPQSLRVFVA